MAVDMSVAIRAEGLESFGRYYSLYRSKVESTDDPERRGRIQVVIPGINADKPLWANPKFHNCGSGYGTFFPPEVGDTVYVFFELGNPTKPIYDGGWYGTDELPTEFDDGYVQDEGPKVRGIKTKYGHVLLFDDDKGKIRLATKDGNQVLFDDDGKKVEIRTKQGLVVTLDDENKEVTIDSTSDQIIMSSSGIKVGSSSSSQPLVLGYQILSWLASLYGDVVKMGGVLGIPPATQPPTSTLLSQRHKTQ